MTFCDNILTHSVNMLIYSDTFYILVRVTLTPGINLLQAHGVMEKTQDREYEAEPVSSPQ